MGTIKEFNYLMPTKIVFGVNSINAIGSLAANFGGKAVLVTGKSSAKKFGYSQKVTDLLKENKIETVLFDEVTSNPDAAIIDKGAAFAREKNCKFVIGLGGGSAIDAAKGIAVGVAENDNIWNYVEGKPVQKSLPIISIPTTAGTGSETTPYAVISNKKIKRKDAFASEFVFPKISIIDPSLTLSLPPFFTSVTGVDTLAHAIEAYISLQSNPISDYFAIEVIKLVNNNLRKAAVDGKNIAARSSMSLASALAGFAIAQADTTIAHVIGEAIGAVYNTDHGLSVSIVLPVVMDYICASNFEKFANIADLLGEEISGLSLRDAALKAGDSLRKLVKDLKLPLNLKEIGVKEIKDIVTLALRPDLRCTTPFDLSDKDIDTIVNKSM